MTSSQDAEKGKQTLSWYPAPLPGLVPPYVSWSKVCNGIEFNLPGPRCQWYSTDGKTTHHLFANFGSRKGLWWLPGLLEACGIHMHLILTTEKWDGSWVPYHKQYNITLLPSGPFLNFFLQLVHGIPIYWIKPAYNSLIVRVMENVWDELANKV